MDRAATVQRRQRRCRHRRRPQPAANRRRQHPIKPGDERETSSIEHPVIGRRGSDRDLSLIGRMWRAAATDHDVDDRHDDIAHNAATANLDHNTNDEHTIHAIA
jgi:hypothetical protein